MNIGQLIASLGVDTAGLYTAQQEMQRFERQAQTSIDATNARLRMLGNTMKDIGQKMSLFLTLPIIAAGGAAFKMASDYNESLNKVQVAFKGNSKEVEVWSKTTLKSFGIANKSALEMASLFGDMSTSMGLSTAQAAKMSMSLTGLAGDLASFKNIGIEQAQTALAGIFTGETESLKRLGIVMTEINLQEYAYTLGIRKKIVEMNQAEKVQLRYNYILNTTKNSQGDFLRTQEGAANQMRIFGESVKEVGVSFGQIILPTITKVITKLNELLQWIGSLTETQKKWVIGIAAVTAAIGPLLIGLGWMMTSVIPGLVVAGGKLIAMFKALQIAMMSNPILAVGLALATLASYILIFNRDVDTAIKSQDDWNKYLLQGKQLMEDTTGIQDRMSVVERMNKQQLEAEKSNISAQIQQEQNYSISLAAELKKRLAGNVELQGLYKQMNSAQSDIQKASMVSVIRNKELEIAGVANAEYKGSQERIKLLQADLKKVESLQKTAKDPIKELAAKMAAQELAAQKMQLLAASDKKYAAGLVYVSDMTKLFGDNVDKVGIKFNRADESLQVLNDYFKEQLEILGALNPKVQALADKLKTIGSIPSLKTKFSGASMKEPGLMDMSTSINKNNQGIKNVQATGGLESNFDKVQATMQKVSEQTQAYSQIANGFVNTYMQLVNSQTQGALNMVDSVAKAQHKSNEWVVKQKEKINAEAARKEKAMAIAQAMINIAVGITKAIASKGIFGVIEGAAIAAAGAAQIAIISSAKMAQGGVIPPGYNNDTYPALLSSGETVVPPGKLGDIGGKQRAFKPIKFTIERGAIVAMLEEDLTYKGAY